MSKGDNIKSHPFKRFFAVARSHDTFHQLDMKYKEELKQQLINMYGLVCTTRYGFGCGKEFNEGELGIDHIIEIAMGGPVCEIGNTQLLCAACHKKKTEEYDKRLIQLH